MQKKRFQNIFILAIALTFLLDGCDQPSFPVPFAVQPRQEHQYGTPLPSGQAIAVPVRKKDPLSIVQAYNTALALRDADTAIEYLAYEVVFVDERSADCIHEVVSGFQSVEALVRNPNTLSFAARDYRVDGNRVSYTVTEWLDPRMVGATVTQPRESSFTAVVEHREIVSIQMKLSVPSITDTCGSVSFDQPSVRAT